MLQDDQRGPAQRLRREYLAMSAATGNPVSFWEGLPLLRFRRWVAAWNDYAQEMNERRR